MVLAALLSNSREWAPLTRAITAYRRAGRSRRQQPAPSRRPTRRAFRLTADQLELLVSGYQKGATVYELADQFHIDRKTVARHVQRAGVTMRLQSPSTTQIEEMVQLYESGLSLVSVSDRVGFTARTVQRHVQAAGVTTRDTHGR